jgi:hypothetical protein
MKDRAQKIKMADIFWQQAARRLGLGAHCFVAFTSEPIELSQRERVHGLPVIIGNRRGILISETLSDRDRVVCLCHEAIHFRRGEFARLGDKPTMAEVFRADEFAITCEAQAMVVKAEARAKLEGTGVGDLCPKGRYRQILNYIGQ